MTTSTIDKKLCWNCEGDINLQASRCPYCGVQVDSYAEEEVEPLAAPEPRREPFAQSLQERHEPLSLEPEEPREKSDSLSPLLLILPGVVFLVFGLALLLFSKDGYFTLRWNASYCWLFLCASAPLLYYGWRSVDGMAD